MVPGRRICDSRHPIRPKRPRSLPSSIPLVGVARPRRCPATTPAVRRATRDGVTHLTADRGGDHRGHAPDHRRSPRSSFAGSPPGRACGAGSRRTSCATRMRPNSHARRGAEHHPAPARSRQPWHHVQLPTGHRHRGDHRHRPRQARPDDVRHRRTAALAERPRHGSALGAPAVRAALAHTSESERSPRSRRDSPRRSTVVQTRRATGRRAGRSHCASERKPRPVPVWAPHAGPASPSGSVSAALPGAATR
jgi:hypothetical protein